MGLIFTAEEIVRRLLAPYLTKAASFLSRFISSHPLPATRKTLRVNNSVIGSKASYNIRSPRRFLHSGSVGPSSRSKWKSRHHRWRPQWTQTCHHWCSVYPVSHGKFGGYGIVQDRCRLFLSSSRTPTTTITKIYWTICESTLAGRNSIFQGSFNVPYWPYKASYDKITLQITGQRFHPAHADGWSFGITDSITVRYPEGLKLSGVLEFRNPASTRNSAKPGYNLDPTNL